MHRKWVFFRKNSRFLQKIENPEILGETEKFAEKVRVHVFWPECAASRVTSAEAEAEKRSASGRPCWGLSRFVHSSKEKGEYAKKKAAEKVDNAKQTPREITAIHTRNTKER